MVNRGNRVTSCFSALCFLFELSVLSVLILINIKNVQVCHFLILKMCIFAEKSYQRRNYGRNTKRYIR